MPAWKSTRVIAFLSFKKKVPMICRFTIYAAFNNLAYWNKILHFITSIQTTKLITNTFGTYLHFKGKKRILFDTQNKSSHKKWLFARMIWPELERIHSLTVIVINCFFIFVFRICTEHSDTGPATNSDSSREWFNHCVFHN